jgi:hypothetical protein
MRIELYVVTTENPDVEQLEQVKVQLSKEFGGLTVVPNCKGYWVDNEKLYVDCTEIWIILSSTVITPSSIMKYAEQLKKICSQKSQLFSVNNQPYFV